MFSYLMGRRSEKSEENKFLDISYFSKTGSAGSLLYSYFTENLTYLGTYLPIHIQFKYFCSMQIFTTPNHCFCLFFGQLFVYFLQIHLSSLKPSRVMLQPDTESTQWSISGVIPIFTTGFKNNLNDIFFVKLFFLKMKIFN